MNARLTFAGTLGAGILSAALVAGCGGGGNTASAPQMPAALATAASTGHPGTTSNAQTAAVSVSIPITRKSSSSATRRNPAFVSPAAAYVSFVAQPGSVGVGEITCTSGACSGTIQVPLSTTSLTATINSTNGYLLAIANQAVTITPGIANTVNFVFNGVVSNFNVSLPTQQFVAGIPSTNTATITASDAGGQTITSAGNLIDANQNVLVSAAGTTQTMSLVSSSPDVTVSALSWNPATYVLTGTVNYDGAGTPPSTVTLTPTTTVGDTYAYDDLSLPLNPKAIFLTATANQTVPSIDNLPAYLVTTSVPSAATTTTVEFAIATPAPTTVYLSVTSNFNDAGVPLVLSADSCSNQISTGAGADNGIVAAFPSPTPSTPPVPGATMPPNSIYPFSFNAGAANGSGVCNFTITDSTNNLAATTTMGFDSTQIFVQGKGRK